MPLLILAVLIGIPALEIYVFAEVGGEIGGLATIGLTILTAAIGALLFRSQGTAVLQRAQESLNREEPPLAEIIDGIGLLLAALFLFLPGFVTDTVGFLLFIPPLRVVLIGLLFRGIAHSGGNIWIMRGRSDKPTGRPTTIDGDFEDLTEEDDAREPDRDHDRHLPPR